MSAAVRVVHESGDRFTVETRGHVITVDQPIADGGTDLGASPTDLFVAALASCVAHYARRFLDRHGLPDEVTVDAGWTMTSSPRRVDSIQVFVRAPGLPGALESRFTKVIEHCTVHNTLMARPDVTISLEASARGGSLSRREGMIRHEGEGLDL